jgi:DNA-binding MarR family transcriptional regulator
MDATNTNTTPKKQSSNEIRQLVIQKGINDGDTPTKIASELHLKRTTVVEILKKYKNSGFCERSTVRDRPIKK